MNLSCRHQNMLLIFHKQLANMQDHIGYTKEHMESLKKMVDDSAPDVPEIFIVVSYIRMFY